VSTSDGTLTLNAPATFTQTLTISYTAQSNPTYSTGDLQLGGVCFQLEAQDDQGNAVITLTTPLTLTVHYDPATLPAGADESRLEVFRYDTALNNWVPLPVLDRNPAKDIVMVLLDHFSEFVLAADLDAPTPTATPTQTPTVTPTLPVYYYWPLIFRQG
jgi:hypothetical protein